jgi:hypothetical protein
MSMSNLWVVSNESNSLSPFHLDIDECSRSESVICHENAECVNTEGTFMCVCNLGFAGDGIKNCTGKVLQILFLNLQITFSSYVRNLYYWFSSVDE